MLKPCHPVLLLIYLSIEMDVLKQHCYANDSNWQHEFVYQWNEFKYELIHFRKKWLQFKGNVERNSYSGFSY